MASLDVLDYAATLDDALQPHLTGPERKMAVRETRRILDDMAFRFAFMSERVLPEDLDYARALEAVKPADGAAAVLARRKPVYQKRRRRRLTTTFSILAVLVLVTAGFANFVTSERADTLVDAWHTGSGVPEQQVESITFNVTEDVTRLRFTADVLVLRGDDDPPPRTLTVTLMDPDGNVPVTRTFSTQGAGLSYMRETVHTPRAGEWTITVAYRDVAASAEITVLGVRPA